MEINKIYVGNSLEILKSMPSDMVDCIICSPPYWNLRNYGKETEYIWDGVETCEHQWEVERTPRPNGSGGGTEKLDIKGVENFQESVDYEDRASYSDFCVRCSAWRGQLGGEIHFQDYLRHLLQIFIEAKRVLKSTGGIYVNMGDTFVGSNAYYSPDIPLGLQQNLESNFPIRGSRHTGKVEGIKNKSLCLIPQRFATMMVDSGFLCRNEIIWWKRNCLPMSATDRYTVDFEPFFFFTKNPTYYFEQQIEPNKDNWGGRWGKYTNLKYGQSGIGGAAGFPPMSKEEHEEKYSKHGRNMRTVWDITTKGFSDNHFAVFPEELVEIPIRACVPEYICVQCGKAREKILESNNPSQVLPRDEDDEKRVEATGYSSASLHRNKGGVYSTAEFRGYTDCACEQKEYKAGVVMDIFGGSGTVAAVAERLHRNWVLIEANPEYAKIAERRIKSKGDDFVMQTLKEIDNGVQKTLCPI